MSTTAPNWTTTDPVERAVGDTTFEIWGLEWSTAQLYWVGRQLALPKDRRQRAINSVLKRSLAASARERIGDK